MLRAEDYIAMRGNAHRAKWITLSIFLVLAFAVFSYLSYEEILADEGIIFLNGSIIFLLFLGCFTIGSMVKAYRKEPFELGNDHDGSSGFGGGCGGD
ncbi:MAG: hypothetical protein KC439_07725 [Yoonia sp.]|nr:hypothetical protein [Yoonia sp.]